MNDLVVQRSAQRGREAMVSLERGHGARIADRRLGELVELGGAHTGCHSLPDYAKSPSADAPGLSHGLQLSRGLAYDHAGLRFQDRAHVHPHVVDGAVAVDLAQDALPSVVRDELRGDGIVVGKAL